MWELLKQRDPDSAEVLHPNNVRRVVRAFEMLEDEGTNYATQLKNLSQLEQEVPAVFIGLQVEPECLRNRINMRVDQMVEQGLVKEVKDLLNSGFRDGVTAPQAIGYKEIVAALDGECSMADAIEEIKASTRRYAKRQRTWFRKDTRIHWIDANDSKRHSLLETTLHYIEG